MEPIEIIFLIAIVLVIIAWLLKPRTPFEKVIQSNYLNDTLSGAIQKPVRPVEFIDTISDEVLKLDDTMKHFDPETMSPRLWCQAQQNMAGIILAVTNMAIYYEVDIMEQLKKAAAQNEHTSRK